MDKYFTVWTVHTGFHTYEDDWQLNDNQASAQEFVEMLKKRHGHHLEVCFSGPIETRYSATLDFSGG